MKKERKIVFDKLIEYIATGKFKPNHKLYSENTLARIWNVKRHDIRDAIITLELMGLVESHQGKGTYLTNFRLNEASNPYAILLMLQHGNPDEIMAMRLMLECEAARFSALNRTQSDLIKMEKTIMNMENETEADICAREDAVFHSLVSKSGGNQLLQTLVHLVYGYISYVSSNNWNFLVLSGNESYKKKIIDQHKDIYNAILSGSPDLAERRSHEHFYFIKNSLNHDIQKEYDKYEKQKNILWP